MKKLLALLFSILISFNSFGDIVLYCQEELATGFHSSNQQWTTINFNKERHTIKFSDDYSELMGLSELNWNCQDAYLRKALNTAVCIAPYQNGKSFSYNKNTNRFIYIYGTVHGYIKKDLDNNHMSAGTCKEF